MTIVIEGSKGTLAADDMHLIMNVVVVVRKSKHKKILFCCGKVSLLLVGKNVLRLRQLLLIQLAQKGFIT